MSNSTSRRSFLQAIGFGTAALGLTGAARGAEQKPIQGFEAAHIDPNASKGWKPVSERKLRVGIVGYGVCRFGAAFSFQDHPNVEVVAVSDLFPDRCAGQLRLARRRRQAVRGGQDQRTNVHDVRNVVFSRGSPRHAADLSGRCRCGPCAACGGARARPAVQKFSPRAAQPPPRPGPGNPCRSLDPRRARRPWKGNGGGWKGSARSKRVHLAWPKLLSGVVVRIARPSAGRTPAAPAPADRR